VEKDKNQDSIYTNKMRAGSRRTYFFDVRQTKGKDYYVSITESSKRSDGEGYDRHKLFIYKEDFNRFLECLQETINEVKNNLLPDFDYDTFSRKDTDESSEQTNKQEDTLSW
jgi:hypothetical protein